MLRRAAVIFALVACASAARPSWANFVKNPNIFPHPERPLITPTNAPGLFSEPSVAAPPFPCTYKDPNSGTSFDLSPLYKSTGDYVGSDVSYEYKMNVCGASNAGGQCSAGGASICQFTGAGSQQMVASLGAFTQSGSPMWDLIDPSAPEKGVMYTFKNGDTCWIHGRQTERTANVYFPCGASQGQDKFTISEDPNTCVFTITLQTPHSCPGGKPSGGGSKGGLSGGWVFIIILLVTSFVYVVGGCVYKRQRKGTAGFDSCPNADFWRTLPIWVKDGFRFTWAKIRTGCKGGSQQYDEL